MSAIDIDKNREIKKVKKKKENPITPLSSKDKRYFSKIRSAVKKQK